MITSHFKIYYFFEGCEDFTYMHRASVSKFDCLQTQPLDIIAARSLENLCAEFQYWCGGTYVCKAVYLSLFNFLRYVVNCVLKYFALALKSQNLLSHTGILSRLILSAQTKSESGVELWMRFGECLMLCCA